MSSPNATKAGSDEGPAFVMPDNVEDGAQLWLIRHGQTEWSRDGKHTGRTDIALTERGEEEARALAPLMQRVRPAVVLCSPRERARRTAELAGLHIDAIDDDLAEWDYGDYEGLTSAEIQRDVPGWTIFSNGTRNGEQAADVRERTDRVLTRAAEALERGPVVLVAHGHISRVLGVRWIGLPVRAGAHFLLSEAAPCVLGAEKGVPVIASWNRPNPATSEEIA
ncbi:MAG TPA: histidine phosphatase family protein [Jatrophihabitantaceae bacterium]|nr:histidine phosphatase family protein [Jatrophihabitantaceae bacterium]